MTHLIGQDRSQTLLLPESLDDYVGARRTRFTGFIKLADAKLDDYLQRLETSDAAE